MTFGWGEVTGGEMTVGRNDRAAIIFSPIVHSPTTMLSNQTSLKVKKFLLRRWNKNSFKGFRWLSTAWRKPQDNLDWAFLTHQTSIETFVIFPAVICKFIRCFAQVACSGAPVCQITSVFMSWWRVCLPRGQNYSITSKKTLFWSFSGSFRPKAVLSYNFLRSSSHIGGLCSTFASPCRSGPHTCTEHFVCVAKLWIIDDVKTTNSFEMTIDLNLRLFNVLFE